MCSLWSKCSGLHKSSQNAFVKPNKDWCWLQWLWSGRWSVNYYSWSRLGPAWQRSTSIARLGVKYVSICPLLPAAAAHFMPLNNSPSNNHRPLQWQWRGPALRECLDSVHGQPSKLKHFFNFAPINSAPRGHPSVCPRWCPQMSAPGCPGWGRGLSAQTRTSHQPGRRHQLLKDKMD